METDVALNSRYHNTVANSSPQDCLPALAAVAKNRDTLPTSEAAPVIHRAPQTLRKWACLQNGPIRPIRINGRLAWRVSDLRELLSAVTK